MKIYILVPRASRLPYVATRRKAAEKPCERGWKIYCFRKTFKIHANIH